MQTGKNWANRPHSPPGNDGATNMHKSIAMGMTAPASKRMTKPVGMKGSTTGKTKAVGLSNR